MLTSEGVSLSVLTCRVVPLSRLALAVGIEDRTALLVDIPWAPCPATVASLIGDRVEVPVVRPRGSGLLLAVYPFLLVVLLGSFGAGTLAGLL
jgi:hypothetical protein